MHTQYSLLYLQLTMIAEQSDYNDIIVVSDIQELYAMTRNSQWLVLFAISDMWLGICKLYRVHPIYPSIYALNSVYRVKIPTFSDNGVLSDCNFICLYWMDAKGNMLY